MHIKTFEINNYKSFRASGERALSPGVNVIVGQNNVGKTALVEAVSLRFINDPPRSLETKPRSSTRLEPQSVVRIAIELGREELTDLLADHFGQFLVPCGYDPVEPWIDRFISDYLAADEHQIHITCAGGPVIEDAALSWFDVHPTERRVTMRCLNFRVDPSTRQLQHVGEGTSGFEGTLASQLANLLLPRIYRFRAERTIPDDSEITADANLAPDASNLANALHDLQINNTSRFSRFNGLVQLVLPDVHQVSTERVGSQVRIQVWSVDPDLERADLAIPLSQSGSGIGQVLAMLLLLVNSDDARSIIIDEPQSYLHPGAVRKLFDVFATRSTHSHQLIVTTHSPTVITAANASAVLRVRKEQAESQIDHIDLGNAQELRDTLAEVGARLADVFGADNVLWVEGRTEEECFPDILTSIVRRPLLGTTILGLLNTGDLQGKHAETVMGIYQRLSGGGALLPPAIGFVFDKEGKTPEQCQDLIRRLGEQAHFLRRRTYENYLLNPEAIAALASSIEGFTSDGSPITADEVREWIDANGWEKKYIASAADRSPDRWLSEVHGAKILEDLFTQLSETRVEYLKVEHGKALTTWLIQNSHGDLADLADLLDQLIPPNTIA